MVLIKHVIQLLTYIKSFQLVIQLIICKNAFHKHRHRIVCRTTEETDWLTHWGRWRRFAFLHYNCARRM